MKKLWKFKWDMTDCLCVGLFKATEEEVRNLIGKDVHFGEICGRHSDIEGTIEEGEITLVSEDPVVVNAVPEIGYNPLEYTSDCFE